MALGFVPYLLDHLSAVAGKNYPGMKITPAGFVKALVENKPSLNITRNGETIDPMQLNTLAGHIRELKLKFLPRALESQVETEDNCDNDLQFHYGESEITAPNFAKLSFWLDWRFVERYEKEASNPVNLGKPSYGTIKEMETQIMNTVNAIVQKMDTTLLTATTWGENVVTGNNAATSINIDKSGSTLNLTDGILRILSDYQVNEGVGQPIIVGNGLMNSFEIGKSSFGANGAGMNIAALSGYKWYHDIKSATVWGANQVGVFQPGTIGLVDIDRYIAWKSGRHGTSHFAQIELPIESGDGSITKMRFNIQIKEMDCPAEYATQYGVETGDRGWQVIITKRYGLWQMPGTTVQATDRLIDVNGAFRYALTNDCDPCPVPTS